MLNLNITQAQKYQDRLRIGFYGISGAGKTPYSLALAEYAAKNLNPVNCNGKVLMLDTEHDRALSYRNSFDFENCVDHVDYEQFISTNFKNEPLVFKIPHLIDLLKQLNSMPNPYSVILIDSLTQFWEGRGGALQQVEQTSKGRGFYGWGKMTPILNNLNDILNETSKRSHLIVTVRSKQEWQEEVNSRGKTEFKRVSNKPKFRDDLLYGLDVFAEIARGGSLRFEKAAPPYHFLDQLEFNRKQDASGKFIDWDEHIKTVIDLFVGCLNGEDMSDLRTKKEILTGIQSKATAKSIDMKVLAHEVKRRGYEKSSEMDKTSLIALSQWVDKLPFGTTVHPDIQEGLEVMYKASAATEEE